MASISSFGVLTPELKLIPKSRMIDIINRVEWIASFVFFAEFDVWWFLIESNSKAFEFMFNEFLVCDWFQAIQDNEDHITRFGRTNDLKSSQ